jgi:hypothetical protein
MSAGGAFPAGSGRSARLDPFALPVRYRAIDAGADRHERVVEIGRDRVVVRRAVGGIPMKVSTPVANYLGIAVRIIPPRDHYEGVVAVMLEHRDPGLSVPLFLADDGFDVAVECDAWARVLGVPTLSVDADGNVRRLGGPLGALHPRDVVPRRRGRSLKFRRSLRRLSRKPGAAPLAVQAVYRGEREIIARN